MIYIVQSFWGDQSGDLFGAYSTREKAKQAIANYAIKEKGVFEGMLAAMTRLEIYELELDKA